MGKVTLSAKMAISDAIEEKIIVNDALYINIAWKLSAKLVTADLKQFEVAKKYVRAEMV